MRYILKIQNAQLEIHRNPTLMNIQYICQFINEIFFYIDAAVHNRIGGDSIGIVAGVNVGQPAPAQIQPQQPVQPQPPHQQPLRLPSVDRDINNAGTNYPAEENKCYKVSVSFDR